MNSRTIIIGVILLVLFDLLIFRCSRNNREKIDETALETIAGPSEIKFDDSIAFYQTVRCDIGCNPSANPGMEPKFAYTASVTSLGGSPAIPAALIPDKECNQCNDGKRSALVYGVAL